MQNNENKERKSILKKWWFWTLIVILIIMAIILTIVIRKNTFSSSTANKTHNTSSSNIIVANDEDKNLIKNFNKIKMGMTYDQVKVILGEGKIDEPPIQDDIITYSWFNNNSNVIIVGIRDNKTVLKSMAMPDFINAKVTLKMFNKIKKEMTYKQVKSVFGEGQITSQSEMDGGKCEEYIWVNSDYSSIKITFENNKVLYMSQNDLK